MAEQRSFGWVPSPPDHRDLLLSVPPAVMLDLPAKVDLTIPLLGAPFEPAYQQESIGSCGAQSAAADIAFDMVHRNVPNAPMPSRLFIYYIARQIMGTTGQDSGVHNRALMKALNKYGWCDETLWPYDISKFTAKPPQACYAQAAERKIKEYRAVPQNGDAMRGCLASGDVFIFGMSVFESFLSDEVTRTGIVPMPRKSERLIGGHDVIACGYSDETQMMKFRNSWGAWGAGGSGYGYLPYLYCVSPNLAADFWTVQHAAFGETPPEPKPPAPAPGEVFIDVPQAGRYVLQK